MTANLVFKMPINVMHSPTGWLRHKGTNWDFLLLSQHENNFDWMPIPMQPMIYIGDNPDLLRLFYCHDH